MIAFLRGRLVEALPTQAVVDVAGVGYEVLIPLSSYDKLPAPGGEVFLLTQLVVREDAHTLYGFVTAAERELFRLLVATVSGVGPKVALNMLSGMPPAAFRQAVMQGDVKALAQISGVGKKTAERVVVELRDKLGALPGPAVPVMGGGAPVTEGSAANDAVLALTALGFTRNDALEAVRAAQAVLGPDAPVDKLVRACLRKGA